MSYMKKSADYATVKSLLLNHRQSGSIICYSRDILAGLEHCMG